MFIRYEQRCFIKIRVAREKNASQCFRALQEACGREVLPFRPIARWVEAFCQGREECQHRARASRPVAATDYLHVQAVKVLLEEDRCWTCVEISRELGTAVSTVHTILIKKAEHTKSLCPLGSAHSNWNWKVAANGDSKNTSGAIWTRTWGFITY